MNEEETITIPLNEDDGGCRIECVMCHKPMPMSPYPVNFLICRECIQVLGEMIRDYRLHAKPLITEKPEMTKKTEEEFAPKFHAGDQVEMHDCFEATLEKNKGKVWTCRSNSFLACSGDEVVYLHDYRGYFDTEYLRKV